MRLSGLKSLVRAGPNKVKFPMEDVISRSYVPAGIEAGMLTRIELSVVEMIGKVTPAALTPLTPPSLSPAIKTVFTMSTILF